MERFPLLMGVVKEQRATLWSSVPVHVVQITTHICTYGECYSPWFKWCLPASACPTWHASPGGKSLPFLGLQLLLFPK